ncbi:U-box domain-containing protein 5-like [Humulus lupulus]|uniref:U-box domain-containing protein 5-like n=1 Tax=Humulus lupulus TaxID=3486 RepID=UPI002B40ED46|nr:U-box domain-containing protein 5-like [Humulus lupulus]
MATHVAEVEVKMSYKYFFKVHHRMCSELMASVDRISKLFPEITTTIPRCSTGIYAVSVLKQAIEKAKLLLQYCSEASKLFLALTGDVILSRCTKIRSTLKQSLCQIQDMVPALLASEISTIIDDLAAATFILDPYEEEAGKVLQELIHGGTSSSDSMETSEIRALQLAASRLHILSPKDILLEKRSIQRLLHRVSETDSTKKKILTYFLYLFKKYGNLVIQDQTETASACCRSSFQLESSGNDSTSNRSAEVEPLTDPSTAPEALHSLEFSSTSIASFSSSMNDIRLQMDFSNVSLGSIDASFGSDSSRNKTTNGLNSAQIDDGSGKFQSCTKNTEPELEFLSNLGELSWDSRWKVVEEVKRHLKRNEKTYYSLSNENFVEPLVAFLRDAHDSNDVNALKNGLQLLLTFVSKNRNEGLYLREDAFGLLSSFLDSVVAEEVFTIMEVLSSYPYCRSKILASGALKSIIRALNSQIRDLQENAVKVLCNLSSNHDICSHIASFECIPKLVSLLTDKALVEKCLFIMKNLCNTEEARTSVAETSGSIASISEVLENGSSEEQEHAVDILLSLCSQRIEYCEMVMDEGVIPPLVNISINGSDRGRVNALELLRQLRDVSSEPECPTFDLDANREQSHY